MSRGKTSGLLLAGFIILAGIAAGLYPQFFDKPAKYQNPVFEPVLADPSVIHGQDGLFYAYGTEDVWEAGQAPHLVPVVRSKDLTHWTFVNDAFKEKPKWHYGDIWAPDISFANGKYYLYYAMSAWGDGNPGIGVATADKPEGPFTDHGKLFDSADLGIANSIDPMKFVDDDGTAYLFWGSFHGIYGIKLSTDGFKVEGDPFPVAGDSFEGSYVVKRNGYYYYFGSQGSCCEGENSGYQVSVGRSQSIKGPYLDKNGEDIRKSHGTLLLTGMTEKDAGSKNFVGPGHNAIIQDTHGWDWIIYHAIDRSNPRLPNGATRRPLMIDKIIWKDGWPTVENMKPSTELHQGPYVK